MIAKNKLIGQPSRKKRKKNCQHKDYKLSPRKLKTIVGNDINQYNCLHCKKKLYQGQKCYICGLCGKGFLCKQCGLNYDNDNDNDNNDDNENDNYDDENDDYDEYDEDSELSDMNDEYYSDN